MYFYQHITVAGEQPELAAALNEILKRVSNLRGPKSIEHVEQKVRDHSDPNFVTHYDEAHCIQWADGEYGGIWVSDSEHNFSMYPNQEYSVSEIVERIKANEVISSFFIKVVQPVALEHSLKPTITNPHQQPEDWYCANTASALRQTVKTNYVHGQFYSDEWCDFMTGAFDPAEIDEIRMNNSFRSDRLECWLQEDANLDLEDVVNLMEHYWEGRTLLYAYYAKTRVVALNRTLAVS